ncbi:hypothetical protein FOZ60_008764 [Perkinsus olseni]|uniref:ceramidase n=1 Tax=Perkinsus olseni TaxID=32597 RepID=A0A7J6NJQ5_PEROL|nr:hypothetical protein FOZ60_008764 [Perkinsus olseni]
MLPPFLILCILLPFTFAKDFTATKAPFAEVDLARRPSEHYKSAVRVSLQAWPFDQSFRPLFAQWNKTTFDGLSDNDYDVFMDSLENEDPKVHHDCSALLVSDKNGHVVHGRNMDQGAPDFARRVTLQLRYKRISLPGVADVEALDFYWFAGGMVTAVTADEHLKDNWYAVETNHDNWLPDPPTDPRRTRAEECIARHGQKDERPVLNDGTIYTAVMSPRSGELWGRVRYDAAEAVDPEASSVKDVLL